MWTIRFNGEQLINLVILKLRVEIKPQFTAVALLPNNDVAAQRWKHNVQRTLGHGLRLRSPSNVHTFIRLQVIDRLTDAGEEKLRAIRANNVLLLNAIKITEPQKPDLIGKQLVYRLFNRAHRFTVTKHAYTFIAELLRPTRPKKIGLLANEQ